MVQIEDHIEDGSKHIKVFIYIFGWNSRGQALSGVYYYLNDGSGFNL